LWKSTSLAPRRSGFDSRRLHFCLRSVNGKHAPFVRPRCGFDSCRRLLADVAQREEHGTATPGRPVRSGPSASQACGVTGSTASSNLAGPGSNPGGPAVHDRRGPERLGYLVRACTFGAVAVRLRIPTASSRPRRHKNCCGPERFRLSTPNRQVAGSNPARSIRAPVAQLAEQSGPCLHDRGRSSFTTDRLRAGAGRLSGRAPG
jgi:hypothetical protein